MAGILIVALKVCSTMLFGVGSTSTMLFVVSKQKMFMS
jgi:hypothetical protein